MFKEFSEYLLIFIGFISIYSILFVILLAKQQEISPNPQKR